VLFLRWAVIQARPGEEHNQLEDCSSGDGRHTWGWRNANGRQAGVLKWSSLSPSRTPVVEDAGRRA
jgi:hypothetical protein